MAVTGPCSPFISGEIFKWCAENNVKLKDGSVAEVGDIVLCSDGGNDFNDPCDLGKVVQIVKSGQKLIGTKGKPHPDGEVGYMYVLSFKKQKLSRKPLEKCEGWWNPSECVILPVENEQLTPEIRVLRATYQGNSKNCDRDEMFNNWQMLVQLTEGKVVPEHEKKKQTAANTANVVEDTGKDTATGNVVEDTGKDTAPGSCLRMICWH